MNGDRPNEPEDVPVPPRLAEALAALHKERVFVPPQVDEAILAQARAHLRAGERSLGQGSRLGPWNHPLTRPAGTLSPTGGEGTGEGARFMERRRARRRVLTPWLAAAASFALGAWVVQTLLHHNPAGPASLAREDVNGDGRVDILDALALSRQIDRGAAGRFDINGDGRVDQQDVQAVAAHAVKLEGGS